MASEKKAQSTLEPPPHPYDPVKRKIADLLAQCCQALWSKDLTAAVPQLPGRLERPKDVTLGDLSLPTFSLIQYLKPAATAPPAIAAALAPALNERLSQLPEVEKVVAAGPYLNFYLTTAYLGGVVSAITDNNFLAKLPSAGRDRVMIEYSQPNTHKAFHVGHMRNAALGDFLVRAYEQCGFPVIAANYFGDEGAHVAKCLWYLKRFFFAKGKTLADLTPPLGETLGKFYQDAVTLLDMSCLTTFPYPGVYAAEVVSITPHPSEKAPKNWNVVQVKMGESADKLFTVVCGGWGYNVGDKVAYVPVGVKFNKKIVTAVDKEGIQSHGIILARKELDIEDEKVEEPPKADDKGKKGDKPKDAPKDKPKDAPKDASKDKPKDAPKDAAKDKPKDAPKDASKDKPKDDKAKDKGAKPAERPSPLNRIYVLPKEVPAGVNLPEFGRIPDPLEPHWKLPADRKIEDEIEERETEVRANLLALEHKEPEAVKLWETTKDMCIKEFKEIYAWLNVRFDHDFYESEMTEEAKRIVQDFLEKGALVRDAGAVGADLKKHGLGFLVLLKSDGSTLYATKDLALARRKFEKFGIDKSIYVVDAAQSMHFSQVFKTLELFGYEQAKKCFHLPYGMVTLPSGRMSSRAGTIVYFNTLKNELAAKIQKDFLSQYEGKWEPAEIAQAVRAISLAAIKYGMLNTDSAKDIVFEMEAWTALKGNTGPYLMYAYTRMNKIIRDVEPKAGAKLDFSCMTQPVERRILSSLNEFWQVVWASATGYNSSPLCNYLFDLCKDLSSWYELPDSSVKNCPDPNTQFTRLAFLKAVSQTLKTGLHILGLEVLDRM